MKAILELLKKLITDLFFMVAAAVFVCWLGLIVRIIYLSFTLGWDMADSLFSRIAQ